MSGAGGEKPATAFTAAMAWLSVARSALEAAAACAGSIEREHLAVFEAARDEVHDMVADAESWLRVGDVVRRHR